MYMKVENMIRKISREKMAFEEQKKQHEMELNVLRDKVIDRNASKAALMVEFAKVKGQHVSISESHYSNDSNLHFLKQHNEVLKEMTQRHNFNQILQMSNELRIRVELAKESTRKDVEEKQILKEKFNASLDDMDNTYQSVINADSRKRASYQNLFNENSKVQQSKVLDEEELIAQAELNENLFQSQKEMEIGHHKELQNLENIQLEMIEEYERHIKQKCSEIELNVSEFNGLKISIVETEKAISVEETELASWSEKNETLNDRIHQIAALISEKTKNLRRSKGEIEINANCLNDFLNKKSKEIQQLGEFINSEKEYAADRELHYMKENDVLSNLLETEQSNYDGLTETKKKIEEEISSKRAELQEHEKSLHDQMKEKEMVTSKLNLLTIQILDSEIAASREKKKMWNLESSKEERTNEISALQNKIGSLSRNIELLEEQVKALSEKEANLSLKIQTLDETLLAKEEEHSSLKSNLEILTRKIEAGNMEIENSTKTRSALMMELSDMKMEFGSLQATIQKDEANLKDTEEECASISKRIEELKIKSEAAIQEFVQTVESDTESHKKEIELKSQVIANKIKNEAELLRQMEDEKLVLETETKLTNEAEGVFETERISMEQMNEEQKRILADEVKHEEDERKCLEEKLQKLDDKKKSLDRLQKNLGYNQRVIIPSSSKKQVQIGVQGTSLLGKSPSTTIEQLKSSQKQTAFNKPLAIEASANIQTQKENETNIVEKKSETPKNKKKTVSFDSTTKFHIQTKRPIKSSMKAKKRAGEEIDKEVSSKRKTPLEKRPPPPEPILSQEKGKTNYDDVPDFLKDSPLTKKMVPLMASTPMNQDNIAVSQLKFYQNRATRKPM